MYVIVCDEKPLMEAYSMDEAQALVEYFGRERIEMEQENPDSKYMMLCAYWDQYRRFRIEGQFANSLIGYDQLITMYEIHRRLL